MTQTYASKKFSSMLAVSTLTMLVEYVFQASSSLIAGNVLGESALLAVSLLAPFLTFLFFIAYTVSIGSSIGMSYQVGKGDRKAANELFSQGFILMSFLAIVCSVALFVLREWIPNQFGLSGQAHKDLVEYFELAFLLPIPLMLGVFLYDVMLIEGGEKVCAVTAVIEGVLIIALSLGLSLVMGIRGILLGMMLALTIAHSIVAIFLFRRPDIHLSFYINPRSLLGVFQRSATDSGRYLYTGLVQFILNLLLLRLFGERAIIILTVILSVQGLLIMGFDSIGESISPLVNVYRGEGCLRGIAKTMKIADRAALIEGLVAMAALMLLANVIPRLFGITDPEIIKETALAIRIFSISTTALSFSMLYTSYYLYIDRIALSVSGTTLSLFVMPLAATALPAYLFGLTGVWVGLALGTPLSLFVLFGAVWRRRGEESFPHLLNTETLDRELDYDVPKTRSGIGQLITAVHDDLIGRGIDEKKVRRIVLMIEETELLAIEAGEEPRSIIECNVFLRDEITVILRDSGHSDDPAADYELAFGDARDMYDNPKLLSHRILAGEPGRKYILTGGKNRTIFRF